MRRPFLKFLGIPAELPPLKKIPKILALSAIRVYLVALAALYLLQDHLLYHPSNDPELAAILDQNPGMEKIALPTED